MGKILAQSLQAPSEHWPIKKRRNSWLAGILGDEVILSSFRCISGLLLYSLIFYFMVAIGFRWWKAVGFSLLLTLCAEGPRCLRCLRHLPGLPNHTCHPHPRIAWSFGGWGCRGAVRSSHLGRDQENKKVKPLILKHVSFYRSEIHSEITWRKNCFIIFSELVFY